MFIFAFQIKLLPHKGVRENSYLETGGPHVLKFWESILHIVDDVACFLRIPDPGLCSWNRCLVKYLWLLETK